MINSKDQFVERVRRELKRRNLTQVRLAMDIAENPVAVAHLLSGYRPHVRIRQKLSRYLNVQL